LLIIISCKKDDGKLTITGSVVDQVTRHRIAGATIYFGYLFRGEPEHVFERVSATSTSNMDGRFKLTVSVNNFSDIAYEPRIYASKDGYAGSSNIIPPKGGEINPYIEMYHNSKLILHVWNDTVSNQIDEVDIGLEGSIPLGSYPGFIGRMGGMSSSYPLVTQNCKGKSCDQTFEYYPLWGNVTYYILIRNIAQGWLRSSYGLTLKPDTTNYLSMPF
jgi:hypothetical protein